MPVYRKTGGVNTIRNIDKLKYFCPIIEGITEYYEITEMKVLPRCDIFENLHLLYRNSSELYYVFSINNRRILSRRIETASSGNRTFRYARFSELKSSRTINDFNKTKQEVE